MTVEPIRNWGQSWDQNPDIKVEILWESNSGGYDWECLSLVRRWHGQADGAWQYAAYKDSGCSCNYAYEYRPSDSNLSWDFEVDTPVNQLHEAIKKSYYLTDGEKVEAKTKLNRVKNALKYLKD